MAVTPADQDAAFLREVDENLRRDQLADFGRRWGKWVLVAIAAGLVALGAFLWWQHHQRTVAGEQGEQLQTAFEAVASNNLQAAAAPLAALTTARADGYRAAALMTQAAILAERGDVRGAAAKLGTIAASDDFAQPYREVALVKQTLLEYDSLPPATVIARLQPLARDGAAYHGSAGELVALAQLRLNQRAAAGRTFAALARDRTVPDTIRQRAVQMAGVLGVDAVATNGAGSNGSNR